MGRVVRVKLRKKKTKPVKGLRIVVPGYSWNLTSWGTLIASMTAGDIIIVPDLIGSGNTGAPNPAYTTGISNARSAGLVVLGYTATGYTVKSQGTVNAEVDRWKNFYGLGTGSGLSGIFFDEAGSTGSCASVQSYYTAVTAYARSQGASHVMLNPGSPNTGNGDTYQCLDGVADSIVVFEHNELVYNSFVPQAWMVKASSQIAHIVYGVTCGNEGTLATQALAKHADLLFLTDDNLPNPFDDVSCCWSNFCGVVSLFRKGG